LDPKKTVIEPDAYGGSGTYCVPDLHEFADTWMPEKPKAALAIGHVSKKLALAKWSGALTIGFHPDMSAGVSKLPHDKHHELE
jgi:hypothetical protein